jgi:uncharacterized protein YjdB
MAITPPTATVAVDETVALTTTLRDEQGNQLTGRTVTYSSGNAGVATVSPAGVVTGVSEGAATITAASEGKMASMVTTVTATGVDSIVVNGNLNVCVGQISQLTGTALDAAGIVLTGQLVTFTSSIPGVASITQNGLLSGLLTGAVNVVASAGNVTRVLPLSICPAVAASISLSPLSVNVNVGHTIGLSIVVRDLLNNILAGGITTYTSSDPSIATISPLGVVTGLRPGTVTITAKVGSLVTTSTVTVGNALAASLLATPSSATVSVSGTQTLVVTILDAAHQVLTGLPMTFTSSNPAIATVSATGVVTGVAAGTVTVTIGSGAVSQTVPITVVQALQPVDHVVMSPKNVSLLTSLLGTQLTLRVYDAQNNLLEGRACTWKSSDNTIATVSAAGLVVRVGVGAITVTATCEGKSDTATVTLLGLNILGL